ncbi:acetyl/propionyl/methylcrotonyl-CoA carboxylase subunit alpha [Dermabacteraceae bacterium P7054]
MPAKRKQQRSFDSVLIANRGEIAVRIARACRDAGLRSIAVYADPDRDALHTKVADEAYALGGQGPQDSYLVIEKLLDVARRSGAQAVHPGYGFLAESAEFARAVREAKLVWIGPSPEAIELLGDKVSARKVAQQAKAPLVAGTESPVEGSDEVVAFARQHGLPIAIKAAYGGGGRGLKVAYKEDEVRELYASAVREATVAFGRGECFVERYLERPRHVETQCLADEYGNVQVISTRDCSLQRRHQKLVEEAPAPFLTAEQEAELYRASREILRTAKYVGAGTCEFLVAADGTVSFLEVNTRLQVEHPVSEEVTGIDLVQAQLEIAAGARLEESDPPLRGHSIEFRINGEDPGRNFLPAPGRLNEFVLPAGPGVRVDTGFQAGDELGGNFDSLLAKLIVTGRDRQQALARARRALAEFQISGIPTALPFHREVVRDPAFAPEDPQAPFTVHTRWIETECSAKFTPQPLPGAGHGEDEREKLTVEIDGRRIEVSLPASLRAPQPVRPLPRRRSGRGAKVSAAGDGAVRSPMQGTVVKVAVKEGESVEEGDLLLVLEAMKMEQPVNAHRSGVVRELTAEVGASVSSGAVFCQISD